MPERIDAVCPLCKKTAQYIPTDFGRFKEFICKNCNTFIIDEAFVEKLESFRKSIREDLSKKAKNNPHGKILKINFKDNEISSVYLPYGCLG